ncbi:MAG TPA: hypothetical protein VLJ86_26310, partial [Ramlibacter sp.]|nr:hypothetical protein [Ramlibacter sp.]
MDAVHGPVEAPPVGAVADRIFDACAGSVAALALFCMMWLTLADILSRKFAEHSIRGATEIT